MEPESSTAVKLDAQSVDASIPFVGRWNTLISTTNWDKGRVICEWRAALRDADAPSSDWSDDAWSQLVGGVTPQHVGRLRRTHERFGHVFEDYRGLFWSHFYAAIDWDDAEMWLEGAVQNDWSISKMRHQRWETMGKLPEDDPSKTEIVSVETSEETQALALSDGKRMDDREYVEGPRHDGPDFGDGGDSGKSSGRSNPDADDASPPKDKSMKGIRLFESFTDLPGDVSDAANAFKIAIINHRTADWEEFPRKDCLGLLDALKHLAIGNGENANGEDENEGSGDAETAEEDAV